MASERKFVAENIRRVLLKEYFMREIEMAGFGGIDIQRTPMGTRVTLTVERPGMVIGRKGVKIKELTRNISEVYGFDNPQIEVQECRDSSTNSQIMAQKLAIALERGWHFRRAGHSTLRRIMSSDAKGCQVKLSGKLTGQRHRTEKFKWGHIKFCGESAITTMERGYAIAKKKLGLIGVSVDIMRPDAILPDEIKIFDKPTIADVVEIEDELPAEEPKQKEKPEEGKQEDKAEEEAQEAEGEEKSVSKRKQKRRERKKAKSEEDTPSPPEDKAKEVKVEESKPSPPEDKAKDVKAKESKPSPPEDKAEDVKAEESKPSPPEDKAEDVKAEEDTPSPPEEKATVSDKTEKTPEKTGTEGGSKKENPEPDVSGEKEVE